MLCPICSTWQRRRCWSNTQWRNCDPLSEGWRGCKQCRARADSNPMSFWLDIVDIQDKLMGVANTAPPVFMDFVAFWMAEISEYDRKAYSHLGYVNKFAGSPVHWQQGSTYAVSRRECSGSAWRQALHELPVMTGFVHANFSTKFTYKARRALASLSVLTSLAIRRADMHHACAA